MGLEAFYAAATGLSFALLGFWWVVVEFRYHEWMADPLRRRMSYHVTLYFLLPGIMSLVSLLAVRVTYLWRIGFGVAGAIGLIEAAVAIRTVRFLAPNRRINRAIQWAAAVLYGLVIVLAIDPTLASELGTQLRALEIEGAMLALLIFLGVNFVWLMFVEGGVDPGSGTTEGDPGADRMSPGPRP